jgi:hypothetical protein
MDVNRHYHETKSQICMTPTRPIGDREDSLREPPHPRTPIGRLVVIYAP